MFVERYRLWFEQECDSSQKTFSMIESVPEEQNLDERYARIIVLMGHLSACRENWLDRILTGGENQVEWWPAPETMPQLRSRYERMESAWALYLSRLDDEHLDDRGQIALLVEQLGGEPVDTDYLYWQLSRQPERWKKLRRD
jgi:uncharacterized damage-inducible protein DinB